MGNTRSFTFRLEVTDNRGFDAFGRLRQGAFKAGWDTRHYGRPTDATLSKYVFTYAKSLEPGGCNWHLSQALGVLPYPTAAKVIRQATGEVVATWRAAPFQVY